MSELKQWVNLKKRKVFVDKKGGIDSTERCGALHVECGLENREDAAFVKVAIKKVATPQDIQNRTSISS